MCGLVDSSKQDEYLPAKVLNRPSVLFCHSVCLSCLIIAAFQYQNKYTSVSNYLHIFGFKIPLIFASKGMHFSFKNALISLTKQMQFSMKMPAFWHLK
jgi:hypothetical protein